jgi:lysophospholipase L1-like esterase
VQKLPNGFITPDEFSRAYRDLLTGLHLAHVVAWVGLQPTEYSPEVLAAQRLFNGLASDIARSLNVPALDLLTLFAPPEVKPNPPLDEAFITLIGQREREGWTDYESDRQRGGFTYTFDGMHLTPESARRMGALVADFLRQQLE